MNLIHVVITVAIISIIIIGILEVSFTRGQNPNVILNDTNVNSEFRRAFQQSNVGGANPVEQGGTIAMSPSGSRIVFRWPSGVGSSITPIFSTDGMINNNRIIGSFHTHPNVGPGWRQEPSPSDISWFQSNRNSAGDIHFVLSRDRIYLIRRSLISGRVTWLDYAPSTGNIRQERIGCYDEI